MDYQIIETQPTLRPALEERESPDELKISGDEPGTTPHECNVVIYAPSKTWAPFDAKFRPQEPTTETTDEATPDVLIDEDEKTSVFSMTQYGSLDWDHSGDEFDNIQVTPKATRRASTASPSAERNANVDAQSIPVTPKMKHPFRSPSISREKTQCDRDARGRFTRKTPNRVESAPITPMKERTSRVSSKDSKEKSSQRDAKGRFSKTPAKAEPPPTKLAKRKGQPAKSHYFTPPISHSKTKSAKTLKAENEESPSKETPKNRPAAGTVSCIPFPPLSATYFGLIQEKLANNPFRLLIAVTFLIRTHGKYAIPTFYELMEKYPTPESLIAAEKGDIVDIIRHLGLQNQRAGTYQMYAKIWLEDPPVKGKRYAVKDYPAIGCGRDVNKDEILSDDDERDAWEIGHMTQGPYAIDSWRIFCRDVLRGEAKGWNGEGSEKEGFQPEWMRVLPEDKELRAYLRWMWLKEGFEWDPFTGEKEVASKDLMKAAMEGRIAWDDRGGMRILDQTMDAAVITKDADAEDPGLVTDDNGMDDL